MTKIIKGFEHSQAIAWLSSNPKRYQTKFKLILREDGSNLYDVAFIGSSEEYELFCNHYLNSLSENDNKNEKERENIMDEVWGSKLELNNQKLEQENNMNTVNEFKNQINNAIKISLDLNSNDSKILDLKAQANPLQKKVEDLQRELEKTKLELGKISVDLKMTSEVKQKLLVNQDQLHKDLLKCDRNPKIFSTIYDGVVYNICLQDKVLIHKQVTI